ncbi:MAG: hypothetical protein P4L43_08835 [Syntrophobacteraceae bacterium]|nr:hypothetical protein [Syntrophobacteraceae bacterium]
MQQSDLRWIGMEGRRVAFSFEQELDLLQDEEIIGENRKDEEIARNESGRHLYLVADPPKGGDAELNRLFSDPATRYGFSALAGSFEGTPANLADIIWKEVFRGNLTNDTFASLRHGIENNFRVTDPALVAARYSRRRHGGKRSGTGRRSEAERQGAGNFRTG